jgi:hypothetical protein
MPLKPKNSKRNERKKKIRRKLKKTPDSWPKRRLPITSSNKRKKSKKPKMS